MKKDGNSIILRHKKLDCKVWGCPLCSQRHHDNLRKAMIAAAEEHDLRRFMTLTLDQSGLSKEDSFRYIKKKWAEFRVYLFRKYGQSITYISALEFHKSGYAHLHIVVDRFIPQRWISETWKNLHAGTIVDIRYVDKHRILHYITKYITKHTLSKLYKKGDRRYSTSQTIKLFKKIKSDFTWFFNKRNIKAILEHTKHELLDVKISAGGVLYGLTVRGDPGPPQELAC